MQRATLLNTSKKSDLNIYTPPSELSTTHPISIDHSERLINEIIDNIFDDFKGTVDVSSSQCSSPKLKPSKHKWDRRLKYWFDVLNDREKLNLKIYNLTKKERHEVLYNRLATVDERDKRIIQRLLDYVQRLDPERLINLKKIKLKEKLTRETCLPIAEITETLPRTEQKHRANIEIIGLPSVTRQELLGKPKVQGQAKANAWLKSKILHGRIQNYGTALHRVVDFYPDIENLQVVGENVYDQQLPKHDSDIEVLQNEKILDISSETSLGEPICPPRESLISKEETIEYAININDNIFVMRPTRSSKSVQVEVTFVTVPFTRKVRQVLVLKNIGKKSLNFEWCHRSYYSKEASLLKASDNEFLFDTKPFRLYADEIKVIYVLYQPRRVDVVKSKWILKIEPQFFCRKLDGVVLRLNGFCPPSSEYENKLRTIQKMVIDKSNRTMMNKLATCLASLAPIIKPVEVPCPYQRTLNDIELFEQLNKGFRCERFHDIELLRNLHKRIKKPREPLWDLKIDTLKCMIVKIKDPTDRAIHLNELISIIHPMQGKPIDLETRLLNDPERERNKLLFVRGMICTAIDEWEDMTLVLEDAHLKTAVPIFFEEVRQYIEAKTIEKEEAMENDKSELGIEEEEPYPYPSLDDVPAVHEYVLTKNVRKLKAFKDCLYLQTYTLVCNFIENMVNIVESANST